MTVAPEIAVVPVPLRPPLSVKALETGSKPERRFSLKVIDSDVPFTVADRNAGAVLSASKP